MHMLAARLHRNRLEIKPYHMINHHGYIWSRFSESSTAFEQYKQNYNLVTDVFHDKKVWYVVKKKTERASNYVFILQSREVLYRLCFVF